MVTPNGGDNNGNGEPHPQVFSGFGTTLERYAFQPIVKSTPMIEAITAPELADAVNFLFFGLIQRGTPPEIIQKLFAALSPGVQRHFQVEQKPKIVLAR